jgi:hypothetical protein
MRIPRLGPKYDEPRRRTSSASGPENRASFSRRVPDKLRAPAMRPEVYGNGVRAIGSAAGPCGPGPRMRERGTPLLMKATSTWPSRDSIHTILRPLWLRKHRAC